MASRPLTKLDTAWLHLDEPTNRMVINGFFRFAQSLDLDRLRTELDRGFEPFARFRQRIADKRSAFGRPRWVDDEDFDIANHVELIPADETDSEVKRQQVINELLTRPFDLSRPPWKAYVLPEETGGCLLFFRIHHCIGDGIALLQVLLAMCVADDSQADEAPRSTVKKPWYFWALLPITGLWFLLRFMWISLWLLIRPADPQTVFRGELGVPKRTSWSPPFDLEEVRRIAHAAGCKINDVLLALVSGAMRRYAAGRDQPIDPSCRVRCVVPVNLRPASRAKELGNFFAMVTPTIPIGETRLAERVRRTKRSMDAMKRSPEGLVVITTFRVLGFLGVAVQRIIMRILASKTTMVVTNVPGPRTRLSFADLPIEQIMFWVPMGGALGLGFSIFSYAGKVAIGIMSDAGLVPDPENLAAAVEAEYAELKSKYGAADPAKKDAA